MTEEEAAGIDIADGMEREAGERLLRCMPIT